jgi:excisionase family DNA binding protein
MKSTTLIEMSPQDIKSLMIEAISEYESSKLKSDNQTKTLSINKTSKILGVSHTTVKKLVKNGILKTTADERRIPERAIDEYLQNKK